MEYSELFKDIKYWNNAFQEYRTILHNKKQTINIPNVISQKTDIAYCQVIKDSNSKNTEDEESFLGERIAILCDIGISYEWSKCIVKLRTIKKPINISSLRWDKILHALSLLCDSEYLFLKKIISCNWNIEEIFGCGKYAPERRYDFMGLVMLIDEKDKIIEITNDCIKIRKKSGSTLKYTHIYHLSAEQSLLYELD